MASDKKLYTIDDLIEKASSYITKEEELQKIRDVFEFCKEKHEGQYRQSGEPYYYHPLAKVAKNTAAGAVLITAINAIIVGYIIFWDKFEEVSFGVVHKMKDSEPYMIFSAIVIVSLATVIIKAIYGEGTPLKGGMPSGHSALAFSISTAISLITAEPICIILSL